MIENDYKLSEAEKAAKKREKIKAKKFSDAESSDCEDEAEEPKFVKLKSKLAETEHVTPQKNAVINPVPVKNGKVAHPRTSGPLKLSTRAEFHKTERESPEKIVIQDLRKTVTTMKATDIIKDDRWLKETVSPPSKSSQNFIIPTPQKYARGKMVCNDTVLTYSQPSSTQGITTLTQSSGNSISVSGVLPTSSTKQTVEILLEPEKYFNYLPSKEAKFFSTQIRQQRRFIVRNREERLHRCNHDNERMMGKTFLYEHVCTKGRYLNALLVAAVEGNLPRFQKLFETGVTYLKSLKNLYKFTNAQLQRKFMLKLLRVFVDDGTNSNLFMLLSCCRRKTDDEQIISCNLLPYKHGYCQLIKFIASFLHVTEMRKILAIKNFYSGRTCLSIASIAGNLCQQKALLELGASFSTYDEIGYSPLHYIIRKPRKDMFLEYLCWGADLSMQFPDDKRPNSFRQCVIDHMPDKELQNYILNKIAALQNIFLQRAKEAFCAEKVSIIGTLSELHYGKLFFPDCKTNHIKVDFEFDFKLRCPAVKKNEDIIVLIFPFEYWPDDYESDACEPDLEFIEVNSKENSFNFFDGNPSYVESMKTIFNLLPYGSSSFFHGLHGFKISNSCRPFAAGKTSWGKLYFKTKGTEKLVQDHSFTLFAVQAYLVGPEKKQIGVEYDGQWPEGHRLRDTLLIEDEYVRLDPEKLPKDFFKRKKILDSDNEIKNNKAGGNPKKCSKIKSEELKKPLAVMQKEMKKKKAD